MRRLLPQSLIGQIALVMAAALLVAQAVNFSLILTERQRQSQTQAQGPAIARFLVQVERLAALPPARRELRLRGPARRSRFSIDARSPVAPDAVDAALTRRLAQAAADNGLVLSEVRAAISDSLPPPRRVASSEELQNRRRQLQLLILSAQLPDGQWVTGRLLAPRPDPWLAARLAAATLLIYLIVLGAMVWLAARIVRPLRDLTSAAGRLAGRGETPRVEPRGPADLKRAIDAFNAMSARVSAMLDEKDRMLGAIGHDLRTPLAALRIRAESMEPEGSRERMIATIDEMTVMLDDTLALARLGRTREPFRAVDLAALADALVEEFRGLGAQVVFEEAVRVVAQVRPNLVRRALRNLIDNAVKYGGGAEVTVTGAAGQACLLVRDRGPGIPEAELSEVQEAFYRLEQSRSRETGGSGLGLALAKATAQAHGGYLELRNRRSGGLEARLCLPTDPQ